MAGVERTPLSDLKGLAHKVKTDYQGAKKDIHCIFNPSDKACDDITDNVAKGANNARNIENSVFGGQVKNNYLNSGNHRNVMETGNVDL